jgi:hypothetical protein
MNRLVLTAALLAVPFVARAADMPVKAEVPATLDQRWNAVFATETRYFSWKSDRGSPTNVNGQPGSGTQVYTPFALQLNGQPNDSFKVQFLARGGWVWSRQNTAGLTGEVDTMTDTVLNGTLTYIGSGGVQTFVSLSTNLPTGKSALFGGEANARMDPDLVEIGSFGEGYNIGPTIGVSVPLSQSMIVSASFGYTWRGSFERENSISATNPLVQTPTSVDPGDVWTATASLGYQAGPWAWTLTGTLSEETETVENGAPLYRAGRRYMANGAWSYNWGGNFGQSALTAAFAHSNRNEVLFVGAPALIKETMNTNSNLYRVGLQHLFALDRWAVGPAGSYLHRDDNGYNATTLQFVPEKDRWTAGLIARYAASERVTFNARVDHVWTNEDEKLAPGNQQFSVLANAFVPGSAVPIVSSTGWQAALGVNAKF